MERNIPDEGLGGPDNNSLVISIFQRNPYGPPSRRGQILLGMELYCVQV